MKIHENVFSALYCIWEGLAVCKTLLLGVGVICPSGKHHSENFVFGLKTEKWEQLFEMFGFGAHRVEHSFCYQPERRLGHCTGLAAARVQENDAEQRVLEIPCCSECATLLERFLRWHLMEVLFSCTCSVIDACFIHIHRCCIRMCMCINVVVCVLFIFTHVVYGSNSIPVVDTRFCN
jgi:hypothetical protein